MQNLKLNKTPKLSSKEKRHFLLKVQIELFSSENDKDKQKKEKIYLHSHHYQNSGVGAINLKERKRNDL